MASIKKEKKLFFFKPIIHIQFLSHQFFLTRISFVYFKQYIHSPDHRHQGCAYADLADRGVFALCSRERREIPVSTWQSRRSRRGSNSIRRYIRGSLIKNTHIDRDVFISHNYICVLILNFDNNFILLLRSLVLYIIHTIHIIF